MTLALATRGYLCFRRGGVTVIGAGPSIVKSQFVQPEIKGAAFVAPPGPDLTGAASKAPQISGGGSVPTPPEANPPTISGGGTLIPGVEKKG